VGLFCLWDVLALAVIGLSLFLRLASPQRSQGQTSAPRCHARWCPVC
jgi:hypothetical protein